ncbi:MAG: hypothetical protein Q9166_002967 [cf. Caloplaca sp. 2 TL-2023]
MKYSTPTALALLASSPFANAWGVVGHATVGAIADHYLTAQARTYVSSLLGSGVTMSSVASWADDYRYTTAGRFSSPFHYIGECIVSAIANYTQRVNDRRYTVANCKQALEFLIHIIGDITQPLHNEAKAIGGNQIPVLWDGEQTNLHATWDTQMVEKDAGGYGAAVITSFSNKLITAIDSGTYASQKASWISCTDIKTASACALSWAQDANKINCAYVLKVDETNQELDGPYYTGAKPYIELQIAKARYRLGTWVNNLAAAA